MTYAEPSRAPASPIPSLELVGREVLHVGGDLLALIAGEELWANPVLARWR